MMDHCLHCQMPLIASRCVEDYIGTSDWLNCPLCPTCWRELEYFDAVVERCAGCGRSFTDQEFQKCQLEKGDLRYCGECVMWLEKVPEYFVQHQALGPYASGLKATLHAYKFQGDFRQVAILVAYLQPALVQFRHALWVVLPNSQASIDTRGFRPTYELLKMAKVNFCDPLMYVGDGQHQATKNRHQRLALQQPFALRDETQQKILQKAKQIVIFDDVYTTGATLMCAKNCIAPYLSQQVQMKLKSLTLARD